nr:ribosomal protein S18-alanine N-acetyltransferase [Acetobacter fallax]
MDIVEAGAGFCDVFAAIHAESFEENERWSSSAFQSFFETPKTFALIALMEGEPVGFILARLIADEAEILTLAVRGTGRRRGVASTLVRTLQDHLKDINIIRLFLEVSILNGPAKALYRAAGFEKAGRRRRYYADGSDADVMVWEN